MPRRKQQNPQPVKLDSEDGVAVHAPGSITVETDLLLGDDHLGDDLEFGNPDNDHKIPGLEKYSDAESAEIGFSVYTLGDDESPAYSQLSMESDTDDPRTANQNERDEGARAPAHHEPPFPPYLFCRGCGLLRDDPLGLGIDLVGPYCLRCCKAGREAKGADFSSPFGAMRSGGETHSREDSDDAASEANTSQAGNEGDDGGPSKLSSCHLCGFSSRYANHVKRHMKTHNGEKPYNCPLCTYASAQLVNLQRHLRIHTGEKPYKCDSCSFACSSLGNLKRHQRMHTPTAGPVQEVPRPISSSSSGGSSSHNSLKRPWIGQRAKEEEPSMSVDEAVRSDLHMHGGAQNHAYLSAFDSLSRGPPPPPPPLPPPPVRQPATLLEVSADGRGHNSIKRSRIGHRTREDGPSASAEEAARPELNMHSGAPKEDYLSAFDSLRGVPPPAPHRPPQPPPLLEGGRSRIGHRTREEGPSASGEEAVRPELNMHSGAPKEDYLSAFDSLRGVPPPAPHRPPLPPPLLEGTTNNQAGTTRAGGVVVGDSRDALPPLLFPYTCRLCGVVLEDEDGSSAQICAKCTLDLLTKDSSSPNSPGERSDKVYTCPICPFLTHYPNHLARHMKTHSGEKPYKCPQCDYASAHFDNLKRHHRVHTGEKPYKCHLCDYACGNLANLKRHQRVHSGVKPFQCPLCNYTCNQSMNLKRHMLRHTGEKPYKCQECGYTTGHWDNYKRHQKKHGLATDGWVKRMPGHEEDEDEEDEDDGMGGGGVVHPERKEGGGVDMQYMLGRGGGVVPHT